MMLLIVNTIFVLFAKTIFVYLLSSYVNDI